MTPPIFETVDVPAVRAFLKAGSGPTRFYPFGLGPQPPQYPYAVWQTVGGNPENHITEVPDIDRFITQIDVYVKDDAVKGAETARNIARAIRDAVEPVAKITSWIGDRRDPLTKSYVYSFVVDWLTPR